MLVSCPRCESQIDVQLLQDSSTLCPSCGYTITKALLSDETVCESGGEAVSPVWGRVGASSGVTAPTLATVAEGPQRILNRYHVESTIGAGGFGVVYLAVDELLRRRVAIKVPHPELFSSPKHAEEFIQEARSAAMLKHPGIVGVYDVASTPSGQCYVVLEYIDGESLSKTMRRGLLPRNRVAEIMAAVADAIHFAHKNGLVHRDLKPSNILLDKRGQPHVADFGLALDEQTQNDKIGEVAGTPLYMAPEQVRGESHHLDGRADVWSLGAMTYQMLAGRVPFSGKREQVFEQILNREVKPLRQIDDTIPAELERICLKCLAKSPGDRYATAADFANDLRRWLNTQGSESVWRRPRQFAMIMLIPFALVTFGGLAAWHNTRPKEFEFRPSYWTDLLVREPERLLCRQPMLTSQTWSKQGNLRVDSTTSALYKLARAPHNGYRFRVRLQQTEWTGGPGVFFGLHKRPSSGPDEVFAFQTIELYRYTKSQDFALLWLSWESTCHSGGWISYRTSQIAEAPVSRLRPGHEQLLEISVSDHGLEGVLWDDQLVPGLDSKSVDRDLELVPAASDLGLFIRTGSARYNEARLMPHF